MFPLLASFFRAFFLDELAFRRWVRGAMFTFAASGSMFADQIAELLDAPHAVKTIKLLALFCAFVGGSMQSSAKGRKDAAAAPQSRGYVRLAVLLALCAIALLALPLLSCATESHATSVSHSDEQSQGDTTSKSHGQLDEHSTDASQIRQDENVVTARSGGALDIIDLGPDGKPTRWLHREPVEVKRNAQKTASVQKALEADAKSLLDGDSDAKTKSSGKADSASAGEKSAKPSMPMSCAMLGGGGGFLLLLAAGWIAWRWIKSSRAAALLKAAADVVNPLP